MTLVYISACILFILEQKILLVIPVNILIALYAGIRLYAGKIGLNFNLTRI